MRLLLLFAHHRELTETAAQGGGSHILPWSGCQRSCVVAFLWVTSFFINTSRGQRLRTAEGGTLVAGEVWVGALGPLFSPNRAGQSSV